MPHAWIAEIPPDGPLFLNRYGRRLSSRSAWTIAQANVTNGISGSTHTPSGTVVPPIC